MPETIVEDATACLARIVKYEKQHHLEIVQANNELGAKALRTPLIKCPEMVYQASCIVCRWYGGVEEECEGGI